MGRNARFARTASEDDLAQADVAFMFAEEDDTATTSTTTTTAGTSTSSSSPRLSGSDLYTAATTTTATITAATATAGTTSSSSSSNIPSSDLYTTATTDSVVAKAVHTRAAKRAPRSQHIDPPVLPATAAQVTDLASLSSLVKALSTAIVTAVQDGKSVTAPNKRLIILAAEETRRAMAAFERIAAPTTPAQPTDNMETTTSPIGSHTATPPALTDSSFKRELAACVREEFGKLKAELTKDARRAAARTPTDLTYAQMARKQTPSQQQQQHHQQQHQQQRTATPFSRPPLPPRVSRPAIVVATKAEVFNRQQAIEAFRRSISFRESNYAPARVQPVSHNKLRVEFETDQQRDDALLRLGDASEVTAEPARTLKPMLILKGISKDTPSSELADIVRRQNNCTNGELALKFVRRNRNENLYSAVLVASPDVWRKLVDLGRVCVDHQRVHVERFSPFIQCFACLQFGHVRKNCIPSAPKPCACCASAAHQEPECPLKADKNSIKCYNCTNRNAKFNNNDPVNHKATSGSCSVARAMRARVESRVDYGTC